MKKRVAYFIIDGKQFGDEKSSPLNITFDIQYMGNTLVPLMAKFSIDNLKEDDIAYITTNTALFSDRRRKIQFWCGYENNVRMLFDGEIEKAHPSGKPDTSLNIEAWTSIYSMGKKIEIKANNIKCLDLLRSAVKECGYKLSCPSALQNAPQMQRYISYFSMSGSAHEYLFRVIRDITGCYVVKDQILITISNGVISVGWANKANNKSQPIYDPDTGEEIPTDDKIQINQSTGMISIPEPTTAGVNVRVLLDTTLGVGDTIYLMSSMLPIYNGEYNIYGINHHGQTRGKEFYTDLICLRVQGK